MNNRGWTLHFGLVLLVIIGILTLIFGWKTLIYVAGFFVAITLCVWLYDIVTHNKTCKECIAAQNYVKSRNPEWRVWTSLRSHRAKEDTEMVIAVFYEIPNQLSRPAPYLLVSVEYGAQRIRELDHTEYDRYGMKNYK